jgi:hypothetical protein
MPVTISGTGFSTVAGENTVTFNGIAATVTSATATQIVAPVPAGATSGPIAVSNANGSATSGTAFNVTTTIGIILSPATATVAAGTSKQFTATVTGTTDQRVLWRLEGVGALTVGTLSSTGLYSVPSTFSDSALVIIKAFSLADPSKFATAIVSVVPSTPLGPYTSPQVSVVIDQSTSASGPFQAPQVSVGRNQLSSSSGPFIAPQVSVGMNQSSSSSGPFAAPQVSVGIQPSSTASGPFVAPQISVSLIPIISVITPNNGTQGATGLLITITGAGLSNATSLSFLLNGAADTSMTAANLTSNAEGTQATANITISSTAPAGVRVARITASNGSSPAAMMEGNTFNITIP